MDRLEIEGELPVALKLVDGQTELKLKKVVMHQMTAIEYVESQAKLEPVCYIGIADIAAMTKLISEDGEEYEIQSDHLHGEGRICLFHPCQNSRPSLLVH